MYTKITQKHSSRLGNLAKLAADLAAMLDDPFFQVTGEESYVRQGTADRRELIFNAYCTVLAKAGVKLPKLEPVLYLVHIDDKVEERDKEKAAQIQSFVRKQLEKKGKKTKSHAGCEAIIDMISLFPSVMGWSSINEKKLTCKLNQLLVKAGKDPIRPDYAKSGLEGASDKAAPRRDLKVLVVDDDKSEITRTMLGLAGWDKVGVKSLLYVHERNGAASERMVALAQKIIAEKPDVVLMDEGLDRDFKGSELIPVINAEQKLVDSKKRIIFVANTGGSDEELRFAGAYKNCDKGRKLEGVQMAFVDAGMATA
jgi:CheY-like chemotaxis protein